VEDGEDQRKVCEGFEHGRPQFKQAETVVCLAANDQADARKLRNVLVLVRKSRAPELALGRRFGLHCHLRSSGPSKAAAWERCGRTDEADQRESRIVEASNRLGSG
jgi:hypothetical protein